MGPDYLKTGGERGIRTLDRLLTYTPLAGARLRPLGHLSEQKTYLISRVVSAAPFGTRVTPYIHVLRPFRAN